VPTLVFEHPYFTQTDKALKDAAVFLHRRRQELRNTRRYQVLSYRVFEVFVQFSSGRMVVLDAKERGNFENALHGNMEIIKKQK
jgi:TATA-box binding protein (TBP) (component of TFIID and TFIIIB)